MFNSSKSDCEPIYIPINFEFFKDGLKSLVMERGRQNEIIRMIVEIDQLCGEWDFTEVLIAHFKAMELEMMDEEKCGPITPLKIEL